MAGHHLRVGDAGGSADEHAKRLLDEAGAWAAGAEGERRVAAALADLPDTWVVVHDRLLRPGRSEANLDHIAVGPGGVYLIDAKNRAGVVTEHEGGLFQHRSRNGVRESISLAAELVKVHGMAAYMAAEADVPVIPVLCLAGSRAAEFGEPQMVRGVWVVPVGALSGWLRTRDVIVTTHQLPGLATRVITEFPSTTTDAALLSAMGGAKETRRKTTRPRAVRSTTPRRTRRKASRTARAVSVIGRLLLLGIGLVLASTVVTHLPDILEELFDAQPGTSAIGPSIAPPVTDAPTSTGPGASKPSTARPTKAATTAKASKRVAPPVAARPLGPPDCSDATAAEISSILRRTVKPIVTSRGCAWGTRLDDPTTQLVGIVMKSDHDAHEIELATSVKQRRVVYGGGVDTSYRPATTASVASGQWITRGAKPVRARADTVVVVATTKLGIMDDKARAMAVAIAAAANS